MNNYQKILTALVIVLVLINVLLLGFVWHHRPFGKVQDRMERADRQRQEMAGRMIPRQLDFNKEQTIEFQEIFRYHQETMRNLQYKAREIKQGIHRSVVMEDSLAYQSAYSDFSEQQRIIEMEFVRFVKELSSICDENQKEKLIEILNGSLHEQRGPRQHRHRGN